MLFLLRVLKLFLKPVRLGQRRVQPLHDVRDARDARAELLDLALVLGVVALALVEALVQVPDFRLARVGGRELLRELVQRLSERELQVRDPRLEQLFLFRGAFLRSG